MKAALKRDNQGSVSPITSLGVWGINDLKSVQVMKVSWAFLIWFVCLSLCGDDIKRCSSVES